MSADLIMKQQERGVSGGRGTGKKEKGKKTKKKQKEKNRAGDTMTINVWPVINISLHHCSLRRTKCKGEQDEKFIIF